MSNFQTKFVSTKFWHRLVPCSCLSPFPGMNWCCMQLWTSIKFLPQQINRQSWLELKHPWPAVRIEGQLCKPVDHVVSLPYIGFLHIMQCTLQHAYFILLLLIHLSLPYDKALLSHHWPGDLKITTCENSGAIESHCSTLSGPMFYTKLIIWMLEWLAFILVPVAINYRYNYVSYFVWFISF